MKRIIQYGLVFLTLMFFLMGGVILIIVNPDLNVLKPAIYQWVKENKQRSLNIAGDLQIDFYPQVRVRLSDLTLSEYQNEAQFASIEQVQLSLSFWPLLRKQVIVDHIQVNGLNIKLIRYQDGSMNIDDLLEENTEPLTFSFDIGQTEIAVSHLLFQDERTEQAVVLDNLNLASGRITSESIEQIQFNSQLIITGIEREGGDALAHTMSFVTQFDAKNILLNGQAHVSGPIAFSIQGTDSDGHLSATISISDLHQSSGHLASTHLHAELKSRQSEHTIQITLDTPLAARLDDQQWTFSDFKTDVLFSHSENEEPMRGYFSGNMDLNMVSELFHFELQGMLADSNLDAVVHFQGFSEQNLMFNIQLDRLDLDSSLPVQRSDSQTDNGKTEIELAADKMALPNVSILEHLNMDGTIQIGQLLAGDIRVSGIQLSIEPGQHHLDLNKPVP